MSVERRAGDFPDVVRLVVTDEDGDKFLVDRYPSGGIIVAAARADSDEARAIPVHIAPADRDALVAFLTGDARTEQSAEQPAEQSVEACARCGGPRDAHPGGACDEWVDEAGEDLT